MTNRIVIGIDGTRPVPRRQEHQRAIGQPVHYETQQLDGGGAHPMQAFCDKQEGSLLRAVLEQRTRGEKELAFELLWCDVVQLRISRLETKQGADERRDGRGLVLVCPKGSQSGRELAR